jgi:Mg-chelatase subunit ChlD
MSNTSNHTRREDRGVSELVGVVLLFGIVIAGSAMIFVSGTAVSEDVRAEGRVDAASSTFAEMDRSVQSLAQQRGNEGDTVSLGAVNPNEAEIRDTGEMTLQIDRKSACTATMELSALEYNDDGGTTIAYEGGAIWERTDAGLVTEKAPELGFRDGSLQLQVVRIDGAVEDDDMTVNYDRAESISETEDVRDDLFATQNCARPETLTLSVTSDYYQGWARHLESEFGESNVNVNTASQTVTAEVDLDVDYPVVDVPGPGPGEIVSAGGDQILDLGASTLYSGGATGSADGPEYAGTVTFLGAEHATYDTDTVTEDEEVTVEYTAEYSETVDVEMSGTAAVQVTNRQWEWDNITEDVPPLEVSFVIDESGSMADPVARERWRYITKLDRAQDATRTFLDVMSDDEGHRASLIGYDDDTRVLQGFTEDQDAVEDRIDYLNAGDSTDIPSAIEASVEQFEDGSTEDRNQVMVLLTDGQDKSDRDPVTVAQNRIPDDVTVYTIGVGNDVNDDVLRRVAAAGDEGSEYIKVEDPDELESVFEEIAKDETTIPNKAWTEETVTRTVPVTETGEDEITVQRTIPASADVDEGDTVTVSGSAMASDSTTVERTVTVEREISGPNGTTTKPVTATVEVEVSGSEETSISGEHEVTEDRTETVENERDVPVVTWPSVSMSLSNESDTIDLWSGANVNAPSDSVEPGDYENFWVDEGGSVSFESTVRSCTAHSRTGETVTDGGTEYTQTECNAYGPGGGGSSTVKMFANGDEITVPGSASWQTPLSEMLTVGGTQYFETTDGTTTAANLDSNQWLVVVERPDAGSTDANNVVLLVELGESDDMTGKHLVNVEVTAVSAQSADADADDDDD